MVDEIPGRQEGGIGVPGPQGAEASSLAGAVHGVGKERFCPTPARVHGADLPLSCLLQTGLPVPGEPGEAETPLSTKSEAVPAEGVARLTLHRPAAPGADAWPRDKARSW